MLPVVADDYHIRTAEGEKHFCCEGCLGIFKLLDGIEDAPLSPSFETENNRGEKS
jgi:hypothetical protein